MAQIPGLIAGQYYEPGTVKGYSMGVPRDWSHGGKQYYDPQYAYQLPTQQVNQKLNGMNTFARGYNGVKPGPGAGSTSSTSAKPVPQATSTPKPVTQATSTPMAQQSQSIFPSMPSFSLFGNQQQSPYRTSQNTGSPMVPGYTDNWGRPINGRPAGTTPVIGDNGQWTGNWEMFNNGQPTTQRYMPWSGPGKAQAAAQAGTGGMGGVSGTPGTGGTSGQIGGGIQGGNITNNDLGYASWLIGGSGQMPMGMSTDAQREVRQTAQDIARQDSQEAALDINRRGAYEQTRMDLARQMAEADSALGYGGLAARLYELMNQRDQSMEGYMYDLFGSVI